MAQLGRPIKEDNYEWLSRMVCAERCSPALLKTTTPRGNVFTKKLSRRDWSLIADPVSPRSTYVSFILRS